MIVLHCFFDVGIINPQSVFVRLHREFCFFKQRGENMKIIVSYVLAVVTLTTLFVLPTGVAAKEMSGKQIAFNRVMGNCLACHVIADGKLPGNIGPPLLKMRQRFPNKADLRSQIWDSTAKNPNSTMPPFGRHNILSPSEINKVTDFIYSL